MENKKFLSVADVAVYMGISVATAYRVIRKLNAGLNSQGYMTMAGKVNRAYFFRKIYANQSREEE